jgi:hypothetical protein
LGGGFGEGSLRSSDVDFMIVDDDLIDEQAQIRLPKRRVVAAQGVAE